MFFFPCEPAAEREFFERQADQWTGGADQWTGGAMPPTADEPSYPPLFRQHSHHSAAAHGGPSATPPPPVSDPTVDLPIISLRDIDPGALAAACSEWGVFRLAHHGIPPSLLRQLHDEVRRLLALPFEVKQARLASPAATYFFGTPAVTLGVRNLNWLEGLHVPLGPLPPPSAAAGSGGPDSGETSYLRALAKEYGRHSARVVRALFEPLAAGLGLDGARRASYVPDSGGLLRLLRYPRCPDTSAYFGMDAHTDSSVLTTVSQDEVGGLQVLRDQAWCHVKPVADTLLVNVGDLLQAMSDDEYRSVKHRVLASGGKERISICYFAFPGEDTAIVSSKYREFTYREFKAKVQEDIKAVGFKVGLERFKLSNPH